MKELEKTKRISIAAVLTILVVLIGLLSFKRPKNLYKDTVKTSLEYITSNDYFITLDAALNNDAVIIDIRGEYAYGLGHIENAINIDARDILDEDNLERLRKYEAENKTIAMYGNTPNEVVPPFMILQQLGFGNLKIITVDNTFQHNKLITQGTTIEKPVTDIRAFIDESVKKAAEAAAVPVVKKTVQPKKVIPVPKKKKAPVEGGC
ncbi:MAG: rhodanese-like domain-containing protein [Flavobacteriaceae bacterium]|nr:rhodanese-like domain-containing protein [Flavobacteriaceae bacterium]